MVLSLSSILGLVGIAIVLLIGIMIFSSVSDVIESEQLVEQERESDPFTLILMFVAITSAFVLPMLSLFGFDFIGKTKKILIWFGLMIGLVKMRKIDD